MAGIYVHIPFCRSRCAYCDFFSTTREREIPTYIKTLCREIEGRRDELPQAHIETIYIGGGTPSLLSSDQVRQLLDCIYANYEVEDEAEVTLEMNPDDPINAALERGINRVSLGIQTFDDSLLRLIRRRHDSAGAIRTVKSLKAADIANISIDLIYGLPGQTMEQWERDLNIALSLDIQHLSAYALSYEAGTALTRLRDSGQIAEVPEELFVQMYERLCQRAEEAGFEHYEISNFALPGFHSRHNSSYWTSKSYLGFGPGAHSYNGKRTRRVNKPDLDSYLDSPPVLEHLTPSDLYDEALMCGLRTSRGIDLNAIYHRFGQQRLDYLQRMAAPHLDAGRLIVKDGHLCLTRQALMVSDDVMSDLMADD